MANALIDDYERGRGILWGEQRCEACEAEDEDRRRMAVIGYVAFSLGVLALAGLLLVMWWVG